MGFIWGKLFNREFLIRNNLLLNDNLTAAEDAEFMLRTAFYADKVGFVAKSLYNYLQRLLAGFIDHPCDVIIGYFLLATFSFAINVLDRKSVV